MEIRAEGKLVCGTPSPHFELMELEEIRAKLRPVVISETEKIGPGDKYLIKKDRTIGIADAVSEELLEAIEHLRSHGHIAKILLMPDEFERHDLMGIVDGLMENGDHVILATD